MTVSFLDPNSQEYLLQTHTDGESSSFRSRLIVAEIQQQQLAFPSPWVDEVLLFSRQQIIHLPFYQKPVMGVIPHHGRLILLVTYPCETAPSSSSTNNQEHIRAFQLSQQVGELAGTAVQIDRIIGTVTETELEEHSVIQRFEPDRISLQSFQPYRWT